jgi:hypothetical protein
MFLIYFKWHIYKFKCIVFRNIDKNYKENSIAIILLLDYWISSQTSKQN